MGPDFLCVGMQKAGTGWLFDQLQFHPDFWMPPVKEFHYFDRDFPHANIRKTIDLYRANPVWFSQDRVQRNWRGLDARDRAFFATAEALGGRPRDFEDYKSLFTMAGGRLSGDVTPGYSALPDEQIADIAAALPDARIVLLVRDPIARAWSQMLMQFRKGSAFNAMFRSLSSFQDKFFGESVQSRSYPIASHDRWLAHFPAIQVRVFLFDDIIARPDGVRADILRFIGADPGKPSGDLPASYNRKTGKPAKIAMTDEIRRFLVDHFAEEVAASAERFGGAAKAWPTKYGLS